MEADEIALVARRLRRRPQWTPAPEHAVALGQEAVCRLLPHRDPFLFVDAIEAFSAEAGCAVGRRHIAADDPVFVGHFPEQPIYPGVLQVEIMGQVGLCMLALCESNPGPLAAKALKVHHAVFNAPVGPDATIRAITRVLDLDSLTGLVAGQLYHGDTLCSAVILEVVFE